MKNRQNTSLFLAAIILFMTVFSPAFAEKPVHAGKQKIHWENKSHDHDSVKVAIRFGSKDRNIISAYLKDNYGKNCPPGLAKKNNGCLPPGQAKKYGIGGKLPNGYGSLPSALAAALGAPPRGAFYAMVDKDVLLVSESTKLILDAVTLLSAVQ